PTHDAMHQFWETKADVFIPAAASRLVQAGQLEQLMRNGLKVISCGANVPFADQEIFFGPIAQNADEQVSVIPDFISNCGMARVFAFLMSNPDDISADAIFKDVATIIHRAMDNVYELNEGNTGLTATAYEIALNKLI